MCRAAGSLLHDEGIGTLPRSASGNSWLLPSSMKPLELEAFATPPLVKQALVAAAARITTPDSFANPRQLIRVDGAPVIIHLLRGLQTSGIQRAVITLGHAAHLLADEVRKHSFGSMVVEFVWCEASSWKRGHASNILAARSMFPKDEPLLLVMSDHIFDQRLLRRCCCTDLPKGTATVLVDDSRSMVEWAMPGGAHCQAHCKHGHCGSLVKVCKGENGLVSRIGKKLAGFDALEAGAFVVRPDVFDALHRLLVDSIYCTLAEAMQMFAAEGRLSYMCADGLDWFGEQTVASLPTPASYSSAVQPEWRQRALTMLRITSPHLVALGGYTHDLASAVPLYELGDAIGAGCSSVVVSGQHHRPPGSSSPAASRRRGNLAVKVIRKGATEALGDVERSVMWEVHVLQQLSHDHIVRVMDVIEVVDATYIIMQRVDGPELTEYLASFPGRRLPVGAACTFFGHLLSALRHAHQRGFLHCDVKPDNVRLNKACDHAVLTDWGYARHPGERSDGFFCGTPAYASPEQLTGYSPDSVTGRRKLCPATDVWSLGVTLFEMFTGALPFRAEDHDTLIRKVLSTKYCLPDHVPATIAAVLEGMLSLAPGDRMETVEIISCPHFRAACCDAGVDPASVVPDDKSRTVGLDEAMMMSCGACEDDAPPPNAETFDACVLKRLATEPVRRVLWTLVYAALCGAAIWSHLHSSANDEVRYALDEPHVST